MFCVSDRKFDCTLSHTVMIHCFSLNAQKAMISRTLELFEIYELDALDRTITFPKISYPDKPEVASS